MGQTGKIGEMMVRVMSEGEGRGGEREEMMGRVEGFRGETSKGKEKVGENEGKIEEEIIKWKGEIEDGEKERMTNVEKRSIEKEVKEIKTCQKSYGGTNEMIVGERGKRKAGYYEENKKNKNNEKEKQWRVGKEEWSKEI